MSTPIPTSNHLQLPLIKLDPVTAQMETTIRWKSVERTLSRIHQLRDELNTQLYQHPSERPFVHSPSDATQILDPFIGYLDHEELWIVILDTRNRVMSLVKLYQGSVNSSQVRICEVFRQAILENSPAILIAHNHPSGDTSPSAEDVALTRAIIQAGNILEISLLDHLIIARGKFISLKEQGIAFK